MLRPGDTVARLSGDEFVILCEDLSEEGQVEGLAARLDDSIAMPYELEGHVAELSASIGIAFAGKGNDPEELLHNADVAMYHVKRKGGGSHQVIDIHKQRRSVSSASLLRDLSHAVELKELRLDYQPVIRTTDGRVVCVEANTRALTDTGGKQKRGTRHW